MSQQTQNNEFQVYPKRYLIVSLFTMIQMMTALLVNTLSPIASYLTVIYQQSSLVVNLGSLLFKLMYPIFTFPAAYIIDTYGTRIGIIIGSLICLLGTGLRLLINQQFVFVIIGQIIAGIGRPFIVNCQTKLAQNWFKAESRVKVTELLSLVLTTSTILGLFIPGLIYGGYKPDSSNPLSINQGKQVTFLVMAIQFIMAAVCYIPNLFFQQDKPPTPPSDSVLVPRQSFKQAIPKLFTNKNYLLLWFAFGCYFGIFNGICVILSFLLAPWFGGDDLPLAVAWVGGTPMISGILGVALFGFIQKKCGGYKKFILICMIGTASTILILFPVLQTNSILFTSLASALNIFFLFPLVPFMLQLSCQIAFPIGEGTSSGFVYAMGNFGGFLFGLLLSLIVQGQTKAQTAEGIVFCFGMFLVGLILVIFMKEQQNRFNYELEAQEKRKQNRKLPSQQEKQSENFNSQNEIRQIQISLLNNKQGNTKNQL